MLRRRCAVGWACNVKVVQCLKSHVHSIWFLSEVHGLQRSARLFWPRTTAPQRKRSWIRSLVVASVVRDDLLCSRMMFTTLTLSYRQRLQLYFMCDKRKTVLFFQQTRTVFRKCLRLSSDSEAIDSYFARSWLRGSGRNFLS